MAARGETRVTRTPSSSTRARLSIPRKPNPPRLSSNMPPQKQAGQQLIVAGCLAQRYGDQLQASSRRSTASSARAPTPASSSCSTTSMQAGVPYGSISKPNPSTTFFPRLVTTPRATAYLKIAEGCDHPCTFCIIPALRGSFAAAARSRFSPKRARWPKPEPKN